MYPYFCNVKPGEIQIFDEVLGYQIAGPYVVLNTSGASEYRRYAHFNTVFKNFPYEVIQIGSKDDLLCDKARDMRGKFSFRQSAYVMRNAIAAVTIDSFCSHLAGAVGTPQVALFGPAPARVTGPRFQNKKNVKQGLIELQPDMLKACNLLSHCWSTPPNGVKCFAPCINSINPLKVRKALLDLIEINKFEVYG
jgi:ADP-heptose:LPS heptosyltransferase